MSNISEPAEARDSAGEYRPGESIYAGLRARDLLNEVLWDAASNADSSEGFWPGDETVDRLAPSLKGAVMAAIASARAEPCRHAHTHLANMAQTVMQMLPPAEKAALEQNFLQAGKTG